MQRLKSPLSILFITIFLDLLGFGLIVPVLPFLFGDPSSPFFMLPEKVGVETGYILMGLLTSAYFFGQFFAAPVFGELSDRYGRKKILLLSIAGSFVSQALLGVSILLKSVWLIFLTRLIHGITTAIVPVSQATIADIVPPTERAKNFGIIGAAFGLGFIVGPFLGGILSDPTIAPFFGATTPFWFASLLALGNFFFVKKFFKETHLVRTPRALHYAQSIKNIVRAYGMRTIRPLFITNFFYNAGWTFYTTFAGVFLFDHFGFTAKAIGLYFAYVGVWIAFTQGFLLRRATGKWSERVILEKSILAVAVFLVLQTLTGAPWELFLITPFFSIANGFSTANMAGLLSRSIPKEAQGEILGVSASVNALAAMIPPLLSGFIAAALTPSSPLVVAALLIACGWMVFVTLWEKPKTA